MATFRLNEARGIPDLREMLWASGGMYATCAAIHEKKDGIYQHVSFGKLREETEALGTALAGRLPKAPRVLIVGKNSYVWALFYLSLVCGAGIPIPVDAEIDAKGLAAIARDAHANAVVYAPEQAKKLAALPGLAAISFASAAGLVAEGKRLIAAGDKRFVNRDIDPKAPAAVFYTSGTTGRPKGVVLSHQNIAAVLMQMKKMQGVGEEDIFLSVLPLSHVYECVLGLLFPLYCGASVAFAEGMHTLMRNMREMRPTAMVTIPFIAEAIYEKFWSLARARGSETRVRRAIATSDPVRPLAARQAMKERLLAADRAPFGGRLARMLVVGEFLDPAVQKGLRQIGIFTVQGYGITECAGLAALGTEDVYRDGTAGVALVDGLLDIYNKQEDGSGEIRYKGENVMLGYYNNPALTAKAVRGEWYYTGDYGYLDADGFLHIMGRRENCIEKADGKLVCPEELEVLLRQSPFIKDAVVVGVLSDSGKDTEPAALIYPDVQHAREMLGVDYTAEELEVAVGEWVGEVNKELPPHKQIPLLALRDSAFPRTAAGRILRGALASELAAAREEPQG